MLCENEKNKTMITDRQIAAYFEAPLDDVHKWAIEFKIICQPDEQGGWRIALTDFIKFLRDCDLTIETGQFFDDRNKYLVR